MATNVQGGDEKAREYVSNGIFSIGTNGSMNGSPKLVDPPVSPRVAAKVQRSRSFAEMADAADVSMKCVGKNERKVLVIYTGGTIGMLKNSDGMLKPEKGAFETLVRGFPQLHDSELWHKRRHHNDFDESFLVLPTAKDMDLRIIYKIFEYDILLDSSNMTEVEWIRIAKDIKDSYEEYDGFVVLHGTDTLPYTASALSFMFENLGKCIVLTGSQIPIFEPRSDGADNFVSSLLIAGGLNIPEVTIFFGSKLFRANRCRKLSAYNLYAFDSPNCVPLVEVGIDMEVNKKAIFKPTVIEKFTLHAKMSKNVGILRIFPSISAAVIKAFCQPPIEGVVLETYGAGNIPSNRNDIFGAIAEVVKRGVIVVNITQCLTGAVSSPLYETGWLIAKCGVVLGYDMTPEAALTKLSYVLTKDELTLDQKKEMMSTNIRGELTNSAAIQIHQELKKVLRDMSDLEDHTLIDAIAASLSIQSPKKLIEVTDKVYNALLLYGIHRDDLPTVKKMLDMGADVNAQNFEGKSPLHEAIIRGNLTIVEFLLKSGANVHLKSRCGETSLLTAIQCDNFAIINLLLRCGAHVANIDNKSVAELASLAARSGAVSRLDALYMAGADLDMLDEMRQTPLHKGVLCGQKYVVEYLVSNGVRTDIKDILNKTPRDYAIELKHHHLVEIMDRKL